MNRQQLEKTLVVFFKYFDLFEISHRIQRYLRPGESWQFFIVVTSVFDLTTFNGSDVRLALLLVIVLVHFKPKDRQFHLSNLPKWVSASLFDTLLILLLS